MKGTSSWWVIETGFLNFLYRCHAGLGVAFVTAGNFTARKSSTKSYREIWSTCEQNLNFIYHTWPRLDCNFFLNKMNRTIFVLFGSNRGLIKLKRFISRFPTDLCN
jgi:hypothetical protein